MREFSFGDSDLPQHPVVSLQHLDALNVPVNFLYISVAYEVLAEFQFKNRCIFVFCFKNRRHSTSITAYTNGNYEIIHREFLRKISVIWSSSNGNRIVEHPVSQRTFFTWIPPKQFLLLGMKHLFLWLILEMKIKPVKLQLTLIGVHSRLREFWNKVYCFFLVETLCFFMTSFPNRSI